MVYPNSPFTNKFDYQSLIYTNKTIDAAKNEQIINLDKLLQWLCTAPTISSYRINTNKYSLEEVKTFLEADLEKYYPHRNVKDFIFSLPILSDVVIVKCLPNEKKLERYPKEVIVNPFCGTAIVRGSHIFAPGVMAIEAGTRKGDKVSVYIDTTKKCKKGLKIKFDCPLKIFVGNGEVKKIRYELFSEKLASSGIAVEMTETISRVPNVDESNFPTDCLLLQNIPSILCGHVLNPKPNEIILDMCASPGNKTTHLGLLTKNQGTIIAIDKTKNKVDRLRNNCSKYFLANVHSFVFDSTKIFDDTIEYTKNVLDGSPFRGEIFDKILLDAPCSNLGRRPQFYNEISTKEANSYVPLQRKLFSNAVKLLKPGGHLLYSTCTISLGENEGIVSWALQTFDCLELILAEPVLGSPGWPGTNLTEEQQKMVQRFGPDDNTDSVGFFISHFVKKSL